MGKHHTRQNGVRKRIGKHRHPPKNEEGANERTRKGDQYEHEKLQLIRGQRHLEKAACEKLKSATCKCSKELEEIIAPVGRDEERRGESRTNHRGTEAQRATHR